ncbi:hypothetical protein B0H21DRAFT_826510 [Amylocystis lapponica]|nr:hypothetical protein B0H21DRAFT_826510 [Amylocystis lapponica]
MSYVQDGEDLSEGVKDNRKFTLYAPLSQHTTTSPTSSPSAPTMANSSLSAANIIGTRPTTTVNAIDSTNATAGIGIALGTSAEDQFSIPIDETIDPYAKRSSQRAELFAAIEGLRRMDDVASEWLDDQKQDHTPHADDVEWVVTTDSEYVVKGMTEWLPVWKANATVLPKGAARPTSIYT